MPQRLTRRSALALGAGAAAGWRRRDGGQGPQLGRPPARLRERPAELRRRAAEAERAGNLQQAFRLLFRAGLAELDEAGVVEVRPGRPNGDIVRAVPSPTLAELASAFDRVAYGGRRVTSEELSAARDAWPRVREEARTA